MINHLIQCLEREQLQYRPCTFQFIAQEDLLVAQAKQSGSMHVYCHCRLTGSKAASDRMVWCNGGCKQWYHDTCEQIDKEVLNSWYTVETVKSNLHLPWFTALDFI